ncbi:MAG TPA: hypothetical protein DDZ81_11010 [Acetobacteraceae bacterium]|jgi:hypothetical protein|nr:hypothetical protein [Acetobacteraceae bacterium]
MITLNRTASVISANLVEALVYARDIAAYITETTGKEVTVEMPVGGTWSQIRWTVYFDSLGGYEAWSTALRADPRYMTMLTAGSGFFIEGSGTDHLWRAIGHSHHQPWESDQG